MEEKKAKGESGKEEEKKKKKKKKEKQKQEWMRYSHTIQGKVSKPASAPHPSCSIAKKSPFGRLVSVTDIQSHVS